MDDQYVEDMKTVFLEAFRVSPVGLKHPNIVKSLACLVEADSLKAFFAATDLAKAAGISVPDFIEGLIKFQTLQLAFLLAPAGEMGEKPLTELQETLTLLFALDLQKSLQIIGGLRKKKEEA